MGVCGDSETEYGVPEVYYLIFAEKRRQKAPVLR
jgi:hypothetical protein